MTFFVRADGLFPKRLNRNMTNYDDYLKLHKGVSSAIIAFNLGITERFVIYRQRKLGLRKLTSPNAHRKGRESCENDW